MPHRTYTHDVEVQYRDIDTRQHVNHVVYAAYAEQAKGRFFADVLGVPLVDAPTVVRTLEVDYRAPVAPDRTVRVTLGPVAAGESSVRIEYEFVVEGSVVATARTVSVYLGEDGRPDRVPDGWRERLAPYDDSPGTDPSGI
ncbi:MAG: thioesterase family protein [Haloarculaceae archaeon]